MPGFLRSGRNCQRCSEDKNSAAKQINAEYNCDTMYIIKSLNIKPDRLTVIIYKDNVYIKQNIQTPIQP